MMPGPKELFFIFLIVLLVFGAKRIPEVMRALGSGLGEFRKARDDFEKAVNSSTSKHAEADANADAEKPAAESPEISQETENATDDNDNPYPENQTSGSDRG